MKITQFRGDLSTCRNLELSIGIEMMKSEATRKRVEDLRVSLPYLNHHTNSLQARDLPVLVFGAACKKVGGKPEMRVYNGLILLNVNNLTGTEEAARVRKLAAEMPQTLLAFIGSSGRTVKVVVPFVRMDDTLPAEKEAAECFHAHAFVRAARYYGAQLQYGIEQTGASPLQGCRVSYDPDLYYNPEALPIRMEQPLQMPAPQTVREAREAETDPLKRMLPGYDRYLLVSVLFETSLQQAMLEVGNGRDGGDRKSLLVRLAKNCLHSAIPEEDAVRFTLLHFYEEVGEQEVRMTFRTVYLKADAFGKAPAMPKKMLAAMQLQEFVKRRFEVCNNRMKGCREVRTRNTAFARFRPVTAEVIKSICFEAQLEGISVIEYDVQRYIDSDRIPNFWPIEEFLLHLPAWDEKDRIRALAACVPCEQAEWQERFYVWFLSMVAHWLQMDREHANGVSPLLVGPQGCRKSSFCQSLLPPELREYYTDGIDLASRKDAEWALGCFALINMDEFDSIPASRQPYLKNLLQKAKVSMRKPHGASVEEIRRFASFIATSNTFDLLTDTTGSRRFIGVEVTGTIRLDAIDYPQLYAQAVQALRNGERYWFTSEEEMLLNRNNRSFEKVPLLEELFLYCFRPAEPEEECKPLAAPEILEHLSKLGKIKMTESHLIQLGRLMQKHKIRKTRTAERKYYYVMPLN